MAPESVGVGQLSRPAHDPPRPKPGDANVRRRSVIETVGGSKSAWPERDAAGRGGDRACIRAQKLFPDGHFLFARAWAPQNGPAGLWRYFVTAAGTRASPRHGERPGDRAPRGQRKHLPYAVMATAVRRSQPACRGRARAGRAGQVMPVRGHRDRNLPTVTGSPPPRQPGPLKQLPTSDVERFCVVVDVAEPPARIDARGAGIEYAARSAAHPRGDPLTGSAELAERCSRRGRHSRCGERRKRPSTGSGRITRRTPDRTWDQRGGGHPRPPRAAAGVTGLDPGRYGAAGRGRGGNSRRPRTPPRGGRAGAGEPRMRSGARTEQDWLGHKAGWSSDRAAGRLNRRRRALIRVLERCRPLRPPTARSAADGLIAPASRNIAQQWSRESPFRQGLQREPSTRRHRPDDKMFR